MRRCCCVGCRAAVGLVLAEAGRCAAAASFPCGAPWHAKLVMPWAMRCGHGGWSCGVCCRSAAAMPAVEPLPLAPLGWA